MTGATGSYLGGQAITGVFDPATGAVLTRHDLQLPAGRSAAAPTLVDIDGIAFKINGDNNILDGVNVYYTGYINGTLNCDGTAAHNPAVENLQVSPTTVSPTSTTNQAPSSHWVLAFCAGGSGAERLFIS